MKWSQFLGAALLAAVVAVVPASAEQIIKYYPHTGATEVYDSSDAKAFTDFGTPTDTVTAHNITFNLYSEDVRLSTGQGFDGANGAAALARTKDALTYIADVLNVGSATALDVLLDVSLTGGTGSLASAGTFFSAQDGFFDGSAFTRLTTGTKPFANFEEIGITVDFGYTWNFTTGAPSGGQFDFYSVILHEITHGLGIASLTASNGSSQFFGSFGTQTFTTWDELLTRGDGGTALWSGGTPTVNNVADLTSADVFFDGVQARAGYDQGGVAPGVYAPGSFNSGSSISHFDTGNIIGGAVMEHAISPAEEQREYAALEVGALVDIGYANAAAPAGEGEGEGEGSEGEGEGEGTPDPPVVTVTAGSALVQEGDNVTLNSSASNFTPTDYQWIKDTVDIGGETGASLSLSSVTVADSGEYQVRASDGSKATVTSAPFALTVLAAGSLPVGGLLGLAGLAGACALTGFAALRRRK